MNYDNTMKDIEAVKSLLGRISTQYSWEGHVLGQARAYLSLLMDMIEHKLQEEHSTND